LRVLLTFLAVGPGVGFARGFLEAGQDAYAAIGGADDRQIVVVDAHAAQVNRPRDERLHVDVEHDALRAHRVAGWPVFRAAQPHARERDVPEADVDLFHRTVRAERLEDPLFHLMDDEKPAADHHDDERHDDSDCPKRSPPRARSRHLRVSPCRLAGKRRSKK